MRQGKVRRRNTTAAVTTAPERSAETNGSVVSEFADRPKRVPSPKSYGWILFRLSVPKV